jgi:hypothetical protein
VAASGLSNCRESSGSIASQMRWLAMLVKQASDSSRTDFPIASGSGASGGEAGVAVLTGLPAR